MQSEPSATKRCTKCGEDKPHNEFFRRKASKDGLEGRCKPCHRASLKPVARTRPPAPKACTRCGEVKPPEAFAKNQRAADGLKAQCRSCQNVVRRQWRAANEEKMRAKRARYDRANAEQLAARNREYRAKNSERVKAWKAAAAARYPQRSKARRDLASAVAAGHVIRPGVCDRCGGGGEIHAHHFDYSQPLNVDWLCVRCHQAIHTEMKVPADDPQTVIQALLDDQSAATVAAIEALLTSDEAAGRAMHVFGCETCSAGVPQRCPYGGVTDWDQHKAREVVAAACRSLLSKAPEEDGDA